MQSTVFTASLAAEPGAGGEIAELRWMGLGDAARHDDLAPLLEHHVLPALAGH